MYKLNLLLLIITKIFKNKQKNTIPVFLLNYYYGKEEEKTGPKKPPQKIALQAGSVNAVQNSEVILKFGPRVSATCSMSRKKLCAADLTIFSACFKWIESSR